MSKEELEKVKQLRQQTRDWQQCVRLMLLILLDMQCSFVVNLARQGSSSDRVGKYKPKRVQGRLPISPPHAGMIDKLQRFIKEQATGLSGQPVRKASKAAIVYCSGQRDGYRTGLKKISPQVSNPSSPASHFY